MMVLKECLQVCSLNHSENKKGTGNGELLIWAQRYTQFSLYHRSYSLFYQVLMFSPGLVYYHLLLK